MPFLAVLSLQFSGKNLLRTIIFLLLLLVSVGLGAFAGLLIVYKSDLPEVKQLEDYRPNVITELYADDGRTIGSFALERRVVITYEQIPAAQDALIVTGARILKDTGALTLRALAALSLKGCSPESESRAPALSHSSSVVSAS
jgi:membrane peptidoglycan carboxypeptidase